jgi:hypothetical protein
MSRLSENELHAVQYTNTSVKRKLQRDLCCTVTPLASLNSGFRPRYAPEHRTHPSFWAHYRCARPRPSQLRCSLFHVTINEENLP